MKHPFRQFQYPTSPETPTAEDVIASALAHHRRAGQPASRPEPPPARYRPESLDILFGRERP
jgi:hypothetical protein